MNERIKELAKDAGYYLYDLTETHECKTVETDSTDEWITLEKFAQLIVRECQYAIVSRQDLPAHERKLYNNVLKEHFGVDE